MLTFQTSPCNSATTTVQLKYNYEQDKSGIVGFISAQRFGKNWIRFEGHITTCKSI